MIQRTNLLPAGHTQEPDGWRDRAGHTPLDVLEAFRAVRAAFDDDRRDLASSESFERSTARFVKAARPFFTEDALQTASRMGPSGRPGRYAEGGWRVLAAELPKRTAARVVVESDVGDLWRERLRFELKPVGGEWRLDAVFGFMPHNGRAFRELL